MAYIKKVYRFANAIEVEEYHSGRFGAPGKKREKRQRPTPEQVERINQKNKETRCRRKLRANFDINDYFTALTYEKDLRPTDMEEAKKNFAKFISGVRKEYEARGHPLKWIRNIEVGTKGAWHVHLVINRIRDTDLILRQAWKKGRTYNELLYEKGEFRDLAAYMTKTPKTDKRLRESSYSTSRNLPIPEPEIRKIFRWPTFEGEPRIRKDTARTWYLDEESFYEGVNKYGYRFRHYTLLRHRRDGCKSGFTSRAAVRTRAG